MRALVVHEWLYAWAGGERVLEQILEVLPEADLLVGIVTPELRAVNEVARRARETWVGKIPGARTSHRWFLPLHALAFATHDTSQYDLIVSSSHAFEKFIGKGTGTTHVCYCHSPPRYLWDLRDTYAARATPVQRLALTAGSSVWRWLDRRVARSVDAFISNSRFVADRVRRAYGRTSEVIYPPVSAKPGERQTRKGDRQPFLLTIGRLVEYKRVDLLIQAANELQMRLVVVGDGPERGRLERLGSTYTEFHGEVSEVEAGRLLDACEAFLFAGEEDFGIAIVEANAHGRPVVCYGRGGALESMIDGRTAVFFDPRTVASIRAAIERCLATSWDENELRANAARFAPERFRAQFQRALEQAVVPLPRTTTT